ncbi:flagellar biosynthetic protein FliR [Dongia soli]|uniref:Flagellar biosynthetic protein FliR n=1 Tax=Dongia soli TaxID=600628 RepID=A0ABU5E8M0_9PROT|nr:flagellar biosynthetic protein FliR [Dongia soli]MDY0882676.1 flagellar biosynthetic protein FliR [Dongia soli]
MTLEEFLNGSIFQYFMVFARVGGAIMLLPGYGEGYIAPRIRLVLAATISLVVLPMVVDRIPGMPARLDGFFLLLVGELGIGAFFGSVARMLLMATETAGMILALQIGVANAMIQSPISAEQGAVPGNFLLMVCLCLIFVTDLDQLALKSLISTYVVLPPGQFPPMGDLAYFVARMAADSVLIGLQMVAPFLVYGMVFSVGLGMLARLMPTLQVFFVATPLQLLGGLGLFAVSLTTAALWFLNSYEERISNFLTTIR